MTLREIPFQINYHGFGERILNDFVLPALGEAVKYDRVTSFFTTESLVAIAAGLDGLRQRNGRMRLVLGLHDVPADLALAARKTDDPALTAISIVRERIISGLSTIQDQISIDRLATIAWMMKDGLLSVKVAAPESIPTGQGIFHPKSFVFTDSEGNSVAAVGSPNETLGGLGRNHERLTVFTSWSQPEYIEDEQRSFQRLWDDQEEGLCVRQLDSSFADQILNALPKAQRPKPAILQPESSQLKKIFEIAEKMPAFSMVSGGHTALFPHQELAYLQALSRWPVRVLLADEVGLGKTFEAGSLIRYMLEFNQVKRVLILAPKAVLQQWQAELIEHFNINAWVYDSDRRAFISAINEVRALPRGEPVIGNSTPEIAIVSAQLARGNRQKGDIFSSAGTLPDLLLVDEAHAARVKPDLNGNVHPTLMWQTLSRIVPKIPHVVFATATPMQVDWREYHALMQLLGLPKSWSEPENYLASLEVLVTESLPELDQARLVARLIRESLLEYEPKDVDLEPAEIELAEKLTHDDFHPVDAAMTILERWPQARTLLVKTHPARHLTIRNTKSALERLGYTFPVRNLPPTTLDVPDSIRDFYVSVERYLSEAYFNVERAIYPGKSFPVGFVKSSYQQRLASSLEACQLSLKRRRQRVEMFVQGTAPVANIEADLRELSDSDLFETEQFSNLTEPLLGTEPSAALIGAAQIERAYLDDLLGILESILNTDPDPKMSAMVELVQKHLKKGDKILVFSRYTDTLDAAIWAYETAGRSLMAPFAIYTGETAEVEFGNGRAKSTRKEIRDSLSTGDLQVVFCSDAASEGLNLQAARVLINIDVPWNPARLEQRIGRIARLGQKANSVDIYNLWYPDSIEAKMYTRLLQRKDLFELAVGEFPEIIAGAIRDELTHYLDNTLPSRDVILELNEIKNNVQLKALRSLWDRDLPTTLTGRFRDELTNLAKQAALAAGLEVAELGPNHQISGPNLSISFSTYPGNENVIGLSHPCLKWLQSSRCSLPQDFSTVGSGGDPMFFAFGDSVIDPVSFPAMIKSFIDNKGIGSNSADVIRHDLNRADSLAFTWLPNALALRIPVSLDSPLPAPPCLDFSSMAKTLFTGKVLATKTL